MTAATIALPPLRARAGSAPLIRLEYRLKPGDAWAWKFTWNETGLVALSSGGAPAISTLDLSGTLVQRVLAAHAEGVYTMAIEVKVERVRLVVGGKELPPPSPLPRELSRVAITKFGRLLEARRDATSVPGFNGLDALRTVALVQFPEKELQVGETWEIAPPRAPKISARLARIDIHEGRALGRLEMRTELPLRASGKAVGVQVSGRLVVEATQSVDTASGITVEATATAQFQAAARAGEAPGTEESTKVVLALRPAAPPTPASPAPTVPAVNATPPTATKKVLLKPGEICVVGSVLKSDEGGLTVRVESFTNSQGRTSTVSPPRSKAITLNAKTELSQVGVKGRVSRSALQPGHRVIVVGREVSGKPMTASRVDIETPFDAPMPPGEKKDERASGRLGDGEKRS